MRQRSLGRLSILALLACVAAGSSNRLSADEGCYDALSQYQNAVPADAVAARHRALDICSASPAHQHLISLQSALRACGITRTDEEMIANCQIEAYASNQKTEYPGPLPSKTFPLPTVPLAANVPFSEGTAYAPLGGTTVSDNQCEGTLTRLSIHLQTANIPEHDVALGVTTLVLRSKTDGAILFHKQLEDLWTCVTFDARSQRFLLSSQSEHGSAVTMNGLMTLSESSPTLGDTEFFREHMEAAASALSPDHHYLAFVGEVIPEDSDFDKDGANSGKERLYAYSISEDRIRRLGSPPSAPPLSSHDMAIVAENHEDKNDLMRWNSERGYQTLEPDVFRFIGPRTLRVSYGEDTWQKRSSDRRVETWDLSDIFSKP